MYLADTSLWIEHFKKKNSPLSSLLLESTVYIHEFVLGELSLGHFKKNEQDIIFERLNFLEKMPTSNHQDVLKFSLDYRLSGQGVGWIDCHLLHACILHKVHLATLDKKLEKVFKRISNK